MIHRLGVDSGSGSLVPMGPSDHMTGLLHGPDFQFTPKGKLLLLLGNIVLAQEIPEGVAITDFLRDTVGIPFGNF